MFIVFLRLADILKTEVRSLLVMAGNIFAALSSGYQNDSFSSTVICVLQLKCAFGYLNTSQKKLMPNLSFNIG
jgi:hypothetical protein